MRERRWETPGKLDFNQVLAVGERLASVGLAPAVPEKDIICYIEEWTVDKPDDFDRLDPWATEDVTLVQIQEAWQGDFFLLAGSYHTVYQRHKNLSTYCSVSHPWLISADLETRGQGGDTGLLHQGRLPFPELENVAFGQEVGSVGDPVGTLRGYIVYRVEEKKPAEKRT